MFFPFSFDWFSGADILENTSPLWGGGGIISRCYLGKKIKKRGREKERKCERKRKERKCERKRKKGERERGKRKRKGK
jgi:hypothetical protein